MLKYLTHASVLQCTHGGKVQFIPPPLRSFYVQGSPILTDPDLLKAVIVGCSQIGPNMKPCTRVTAIFLGRSREIYVDGEIPLLENLTAMTDGFPPGMCFKVSNEASNAEIVGLNLSGSQSQALQAARESGTPFCELCEQNKK